MRKTPMQMWVEMFEEMTTQQRTTAFIEANVQLKRTSFAAIAKRHRLSRWYVAAVARGARAMTPRMVEIFELELGIVLSPFIDEVG